MRQFSLPVAGLSAAVLVACGADAPRPADPTPEARAVAPLPAVEAPSAVSATDAPAACARRLQERHAIDVAPEPRICAPLAAAIDLLPTHLQPRVRGLLIARDARGPCGDRCPDLASALMSDGALLYFQNVPGVLHVLDAAFDGPRWRGGTPSPEAVVGYLDALGLPDWDAFVGRLRSRPCVSLSPDLPEDDSRAFEELVRCGPSILLGRDDVSLRDLIVHELGHAIQVHGHDFGRIEAWSSVAGWKDRRTGEGADGYATGVFTSERPIVASRLVLGLPRGDDGYYVPPEHGLPTGYAHFDPMEDHAESLRLAVTDPVALGRASPARLLVVGAGVVDLTTPELAPFLAPGARALLAEGVDPGLAIETLRAHTAALERQPELLDALHDPRPLPEPTGLHAEVPKLFNADALVWQVAGRTLRPHDATIRARQVEIDRYLRSRDELQEALDAPW
jgi:hypothetical protein